jgi:DNA-binding PadR family transcriptional regulator
MGRDWGRDFESLFQQHGRGHAGAGGWGGARGDGPGRGRRAERGGTWSGEWGSWQWGPGSRRPGPPPWLAGLFGLVQHPEPGRGPRVRRGDVRVAILAVLADGPRNGYQVIGEISERTGGAWRPSPGSVYPTISQLEDEALVEGDDDRGRRTVRLTELGHTYLADHPDEVEQVWAPFTREDDGEESPGRQSGGDFASLKPELGRVMNAVWQILTTGTDEQRRAAVGVLTDARRALYGILADHPGDDEVDDLGDRDEDDGRPRGEDW